jgi:Transposase DDE domain
VTKVVEWFGFKLHLLVDVKHEVSLAYKITDTKAGDGATLPEILADAQRNLPAGRIKTLAYDKAADSNDVHELLSENSIKAVIQNRSLWKDEQERMLPGHDGNSNIVYDEAGTVYCYDRESDPIVRHKMSYIGYEPSRETIKYRCPAMHEGWECPMAKICNAGKKYGLTVRVPREIDLRRFPAVPRATKKFERLYKGRTAVERVNARLKIFWGADDGNVTGSRRFFALLGVILVVHAAFATLLAMAPRWEGTLGQTKLSPIAKALYGKTKPATPPRRRRPASKERQARLKFAG